MEDEQPEILQQISRGLKNLLKQGQNFNGSIPGGHVQLPSSLTGLMGELHQDDHLHRKQVEDLKVRLRSEGKTPKEISLAIQELYEEIISGLWNFGGFENLSFFFKEFYGHRKSNELIFIF